MKSKKYPYWGMCDVDGCDEESCSGGVCWFDTGYWSICHKHYQSYLDDDSQPKMEKLAIAREKSRDKKGMVTK